MSVNPSTLPVVVTTGGVQYTSACYYTPPIPTPIEPGGDGDGDGGPVPAAGVDRFGVAKIFPDYPSPEYPPFYIDMVNKSANSARFNISYGSGSHIAYDLRSASGSTPAYYNSAGAVQHYASGSPDSRSCRFDIYLAEGMFASIGNYSYKNNPGYLYKRTHDHNSETTIYLRPHDQLGTHESCAFKLHGRDNDEIRSCIEMVWPTATHGEVVVNVEYKHFPYVSVKNVRQYTSTSSTRKLTDNQWVGLKCVLILADDKRSNWLGMYEDIQPFTTDGKPRNGWKLRADCVFTGVSDDDYDNIICSWDGHKSTVRIDGFANVDFLWYSHRQITKGAFSNPQFLKPGSPFTYGTPPNIDYASYNDPNI